MKSIDLSVIIVNYHTPQFTYDSVTSIIKTIKNLSYEIIVLDNESNGDSNEVLSILEKNSKVKLIKSKKNLGFAGGNNLGIQESKGKFILLLNSDTLVEEKTIEGIVKFMRKHTEVGICSCALKNKNGSLQMPGGFSPNLVNIFSWMTFLDDIAFINKFIKPYHWRPNKNIAYLDWVAGTFFMIKREVLDNLGNLDEDYFMYVEDMDYCYRAKKLGWKVVYNPYFSIIHFGGASSNKEFPVINEFKALMKFFQKHKSSWQYSILRIFLKTGCLIRIPILGILKGVNVARVYEKAFKSI